MRPGDEVAGRYRLDELHGNGPMSEVWRAYDNKLERTVALKILSPTADLGRFRREAKAVAALAHENVMRVYDYGEDEAGPFMALEWLPAGTLDDRLKQGPLPSGEAQRIATGIAAGLAHLHARGLVHRDLKPANILFDEESRPKLGDFGLVRRTAGSGTLTEAGTVLGTAAYISPEQAGGEPAGAASDVYSFGVILFRMLTGELPFVADSALALVDMHRHTPPPAVETLQPDAPPDLATLTAAALRKDPAERPADGAALLAALGATATTVAVSSDTEATQVLPVPAPVPPPGSGRRRRSAAAITAAIVILAAAGGVLAWAVTQPGSASPATSDPTGPTTATHGQTATTHATPPPATSTRQHTQPKTTTARTTAPVTTTSPAQTTAPITTTTPTTTTAPTTTASTTTAATTTASATTTATGTT